MKNAIDWIFLISKIVTTCTFVISYFIVKIVSDFSSFGAKIVTNSVPGKLGTNLMPGNFGVKIVITCITHHFLALSITLVLISFPISPTDFPVTMFLAITAFTFLPTLRFLLRQK